MYLVGSRAVGVNNENSDYDYLELDLSSGSTFNDRVNEHFEKKKHCYHYNRDYMYRVFRFEVEDEDDNMFLLNALHFNVGVNPFNPFDYRDKWVEKLKSTDYNGHYFKSRYGTFLKRFYHVVFNLECLKQNTLKPTLERVKRFHDMKAEPEEYEQVILEIAGL